MMPNAHLDHLDIDDPERELIWEACAGADVIYLAGMDKGLSGSHVWRARWAISGTTTKDHVLKIGSSKKLQREHKAYTDIASAIDGGSPHMHIVSDGSGAEGLSALRQEFAIGSGASSVSLRNKLRELTEPVDSAALLRRVFEERMGRWHFPEQPSFRVEQRSMRDALAWWLQRIDLDRAYRQIGGKGLEQSLLERVGASLYDINAGVSALLARTESACIGPMHGDLHAQNVMVGAGGELMLIDFGWTNTEFWRAVDFLMMECSLKFLVTPRTARLGDLLQLESLLDKAVGEWEAAAWRQLSPRIHGDALAVVGAAVQAVRECALRAHAVQDFAQYRRGLVALTAALATLPSGVNRVYLLHSLAWHLQKC